jgi:hypothetical protein
MRTWFQQLPFIRDKKDCQIMNMAVRHMYPANGPQPMHKDLVLFAMTYQRGMSARDLMDAVEDRT